jgi:hypothetical protein
LVLEVRADPVALVALVARTAWEVAPVESAEWAEVRQVGREWAEVRVVVEAECAAGVAAVLAGPADLADAVAAETGAGVANPAISQPSAIALIVDAASGAGC